MWSTTRSISLRRRNGPPEMSRLTPWPEDDSLNSNRLAFALMINLKEVVTSSVCPVECFESCEANINHVYTIRTASKCREWIL